VKAFSWQVEGHLEKRNVGSNALAVSGSQCCPGRLGAFEIERLIGAETGAWVERGWRMRPDVQSPVAGSVGGAGCMLSWREGRESCSIGGVGWWLKRVRALEAAYQVSNS
jgi:hypothetical protein